MDLVSTSGWFAVRCLFRSHRAPSDGPSDGYQYEERITLWRAGDLDEAISKAEAEAVGYAATLDEAPDEYLGLAQAYALGDDPRRDGAEVFSLIRDSDLDPEEYLDAFFATGGEHQQDIEPAGSRSDQAAR